MPLRLLLEVHCLFSVFESAFSLDDSVQDSKAGSRAWCEAGFQPDLQVLRIEPQKNPKGQPLSAIMRYSALKKIDAVAGLLRKRSLTVAGLNCLGLAAHLLDGNFKAARMCRHWRQYRQ